MDMFSSFINFFGGKEWVEIQGKLLYESIVDVHNLSLSFERWGNLMTFFLTNYVNFFDKTIVILKEKCIFHV
jgi:hypothetical protein